MTPTSLQSGMLFHAIAHPGSGVDIEQISISLNEELDIGRLKAAWQRMFDENNIMRAHFGWTGDSQLELLFREQYSPVWTVEDWSSYSKKEQEQRILECRNADRLRDFDLFDGPPHRFFLGKTGQSSWWILWSFHHALLDGRSFPLVLNDVFTLYDKGLEAPIAARPDFRKYIDAVVEQDLVEAQAYWRGKLESFSSISSIPDADSEVRANDRPRLEPSVVPVERELGEARTAALRSLAATCGVSLNTCIQAAWCLLVYHHSQQPVVTFGTTRACRHATDGAADMIGLLINTVPMCVEIDSHESVEDLLVRLRREQTDLRDYETTPLPIIQECAPQGAKDLFESIVVFDDASLGLRMDRKFPDKADVRAFRYDGQTNFPLTLLAYGDSSMLVRLEADAWRYGRSKAILLLDQLTNVLDGFVSDPRRLAVEIAYLTQGEVAQFDEWNATVADYDLETTLPLLFEQQVARTPDAQALVCGDQTLSYRQFNERSNQLARYLRRTYGVGPDSTVGLFVERSFEMMIGVYAIIKAGGAYVPLDPEHPADRVRFMAEDSAVALVLTQRHLAASVPEGDFEVVVIEDESSWPWSSESSGNLDPVTGPDNLAYLLYTSGSTGRPKGVMIEHRAIVNRLLWMQEAYRLDDTDCVLQKTPYTFDVSVWELFWPLQVGARLVMAEPGGHRDTAYLARTINSYSVTTLHFVPSMLQLFVEDPQANSCTSVKRVICSGESLPRQLQDRLFHVLDVELHNLYGPTEAAVDVTWWQCSADSALSVVPIGHPIANTEVHVLDSRMQRVPVGAPGELHIGGVQLARGYHNRQELTAEKFVPDGFSSRANARLYKTGDLVRYLGTGAVEFLGRLDHQVKIRGQRIELGEIEAVIGGHESVREVVVVASGPTPAETQLVAYVVGAAADRDNLIEHIAVSLPGYMVPGIWVMLDALPLSANGKVDRARLPAPSFDTTDREIVDADGDTELAVATIWKSLLDLAEVGVTETFFDVGGNSLLLIRLAHQLTAAFERSISVQQLLRHPTIRQQSKLLESSEATRESVDDAVESGARQAKARRSRRSRRQTGV